jgi:hypothetical protein
MLQYGGLYNLDTRKWEITVAFAAHYEINKGKWNGKAQFITASHNPENAEGEPTDVVDDGCLWSSL